MKYYLCVRCVSLGGQCARERYPCSFSIDRHISNYVHITCLTWCSPHINSPPFHHKAHTHPFIHSNHKGKMLFYTISIGHSTIMVKPNFIFIWYEKKSQKLPKLDSFQFVSHHISFYIFEKCSRNSHYDCAVCCAITCGIVCTFCFFLGKK